MNEQVRGALGVLCIAAIALVVGVATRGGSSELLPSGALLIAGVLGIFGLALLASALLRPKR